MIEVREVTKHYGNKTAVDGLSFSVSKGEILGFLGPNGAGKTTTMRMITGLIPPTSGMVTVDGLNVTENPVEASRLIGYLPEDAPFYPEMTVAEFLDFMGAMKEIPGKERAREIDRVITQLELGPVYRRLVGNCSLGYRHRIGLAHALLGDPEVLILDEPTAGLDPRQRIEIRDLIRAMAGRRTVILSSHVLPEVQQTCERVVIINEGRLVAEDTPSGLAVRLRGQSALRLQVAAPASEVAGVLSGISGIAELKRESSEGTDEAPVFSVEMEPNRDLREDIFFRLAEAGYPILEMTPVGFSLEEIFLRLTTEDPTQPERDPQAGVISR
ncbi:MAG: ABC transporter ATP-binding protein [Clostridia bacterium]